jgi:hypothetical protein
MIWRDLDIEKHNVYLNIDINIFSLKKNHDSIMVVLDKLTNIALFILFKMIHKITNNENICMKDIAMLHGVQGNSFR